MIAVVDGVVSAAESATVPVLDRAARYGDAVFETFRTYDRRLLALDDRLDRLARSAKRLRFGSFPPHEELRNDLRRAIDAHGDADAYVRIAISRGAGGLGLMPSPDLAPIRVVLAGPLPPLPARYLDPGLEVVTQRAAIEPGGSRAAGAKVACYVEPLLAGLEARDRGADDAIGLDREGIVLEATASNVFVRHGEGFATPPLALGILPGITRAIVMRLASELGLEVRQSAFSVHRLYDADEVLLTSSVRGLVPVCRIDGRPVGTGTAGPGFTALRAAYDRCVEVESARVDATAESR